VLGFDFVLLAAADVVDEPDDDRVALWTRLEGARPQVRHPLGPAAESQNVFLFGAISLEDSVSRSEWVSSYPAPER
jgi:hypothetical protein